MIVRDCGLKTRSWMSMFGLNLIATVVAAVAMPVLANEQRILQRDPYGNIRYDKPSWVVQENGRVIAVDRYGTKRYDLPGYQIKGDQIYEADAYGNIRYHRPSFVIRDGR